MSYLQLIRPFGLLLLMVILGSCSSGGIGQTGQPGLPAELPALPELDEIRQTSNQSLQTILGMDTLLRSASATDEDTALRLAADPGTSSWGLWRISPDYDYVESVWVTASLAAGEGYFVGISDYASGSWSFAGPYNGNVNLPFAADRQLSPAGYHYIAILTHDGADALITDLQVTWEDGWTVVPVVESGESGFRTSIADINGHPAFAYYNTLDQRLHYAWSSTESGDSADDWTDIAIPTSGISGPFPSLAEINGRPAISFRHVLGPEQFIISYAVSNNSSGSSPGNWTVLTIDEEQSTGYYSSLADINGRPAIAYGTFDGHDLWYTRSTTLHGDTQEDWAPRVRVDFDGTNTIGWHCSLAEVDGAPCIAYEGTAQLRWLWSSTSDGLSEDDWNIRIIDNDAASSVGQFASLELIDGKPAVAYYDQFHATLKYAYSDTAQGRSALDWTKLEIPTPPVTGMYASLVELATGPAICCFVAGGVNDLMYFEAASPQGDMIADWDSATTIDGPTNAGKYCSMAVVNGNPVIAYYDGFSGMMKYAVRRLP